MTASDPTPWLTLARAELAADTREVRGPGVNPRIAGYYETLGGDPARVDDDGDPWCAVFLNAMLARSGQEHSKRWRAARGLLAIGVPLEAPREGCVAVLARVDPRAPTVPHGHVTFFVSWVDGRPGWFHGLGGNQHNRVSIAEYDAGRALGWRWPTARV